MVLVKEFLGYEELQEKTVNRWLKEKGDSIEIIDIKYSVSCIQSSLETMSPPREFSGILIIYKTKNNFLK
ncbi:MAG TPA: sporulation protein Cse60 [Defluviitaleaceae bacterium]|nr:sporulation protein Cse60 [Candidatus Epulonipiscium sp.]HOQ16640.1 sporulation protein Cse60 [Defluviitaleaceae bacterium]HPT75201.1 sporulation protein Cse60 [Defluviitaleaceae bacterium]HQD50119.1 sporulation protein Cse60 [Defluviitaleaceae bacterium]